jgi:hypothetical protein
MPVELPDDSPSCQAIEQEQVSSGASSFTLKNADLQASPVFLFQVFISGERFQNHAPCPATQSFLRKQK